MIGLILCKLGFHKWFMVIIGGLKIFFVCPRCGKVITVSDPREVLPSIPMSPRSQMDH